MDTVVQIIVGIGASVIIILLVLAFIPSFNPEDDIAEAYLERVKETIAEADDGRSTSFFMVDDGKDDVDFYLAYFGDALEFKATRAGFIFPEDIYFTYPEVQSKNSVCVCYWNDVVIKCRECFDLEVPASLSSSRDDVWAVKEGVDLKIERSGGGYGFSVKQ
ncbi:hypothetical protein HNV12_16945 [Methanococcoides sp. SA1]|nr:hypothetical protein [Methanococcoides sp. SA1]